MGALQIYFDDDDDDDEFEQSSDAEVRRLHRRLRSAFSSSLVVRHTRLSTREFKRKEVKQTPITHSLLKSHLQTTIPTPSGGLWSVWFLTLVAYM